MRTGWLAALAVVLGAAGCGGGEEERLAQLPDVQVEDTTTTTSTTEAPTTTTTTAPPATTTTTRQVTTTTTTATASPSCHPSYKGTCIPPDASDADCAGGTGNGPWYVKEKDVRVVGPDDYDLDRDGDGVGCES